MKWVLCNHHIAYLSHDGNTVHPTAAEIYALTEDDNNSIFIEGIGEISLSMIGLQIECLISFDKDLNKIIFQVRANSKSGSIPVDIFNGKIINHILVGKRWHYLNEDCNSLNEALTASNIRNSGTISFDSYLNLIRELRFRHKIRFYDSVKPEDILKLSSENPSTPSNLNANLYPYQKDGFEWITKTLSIAHGCLLGDEMGLGKTLQIITYVLYYSNLHPSHTLIITPVSLLINWQREINRFAPSLKVKIHSGSFRTGFYKNLLDANVVLTSYGTAIHDLSMLKMIQWDNLILDEGQYIKNPSSDRALGIKQIQRRNSIVISGTPFENHLTDIWSIYDFIYSGLLGDLKTFSEHFKDDIHDASQLEAIISPFMIRRRIADVRKDLPDKIVENQELMMSDNEVSIYEGLRETAQNTADKLGVLTKLRLACAHPFLVDKLLSGDPAEYSAKYERFIEIIEEILMNNEKAIVFTTFVRMNEIIVNDLKSRFGIYAAKIDGSTQNRQEVVDEFSTQPSSAVLVINPKAGGSGLNITSANHVIHYNLEWNPAIEDQASARAYRTGQKNNVIIHRLYYADTIEDYINDLMEKKRHIGESAIVGSNGNEELKIDLIQALMVTPKGEYND